MFGNMVLLTDAEKIKKLTKQVHEQNQQISSMNRMISILKKSSPSIDAVEEDLAPPPPPPVDSGLILALQQQLQERDLKIQNVEKNRNETKLAHETAISRNKQLQKDLNHAADHIEVLAKALEHRVTTLRACKGRFKTTATAEASEAFDILSLLDTLLTVIYLGKTN